MDEILRTYRLGLDELEGANPALHWSFVHTVFTRAGLVPPSVELTKKYPLYHSYSPPCPRRRHTIGFARAYPQKWQAKQQEEHHARLRHYGAHTEGFKADQWSRHAEQINRVAPMSRTQGHSHLADNFCAAQNSIGRAPEKSQEGASST